MKKVIWLIIALFAPAALAQVPGFFSSITVSSGGTSTFNGTVGFNGGTNFTGAVGIGSGASFTAAPGSTVTLNGGNTFGGTNNFTGTATFTNGGSLAGTFGGSPTWSGTHTFNGSVGFNGTNIFASGTTNTFNGTVGFNGGTNFTGAVGIGSGASFTAVNALIASITGNAATANALAAAGSTLSSPQVAKGVDASGNAIAQTFNSSLTAGGYTTYPDGHMEMWGTITGLPDNSSNGPVALPTTFPHACFTAIAGETEASTVIRAGNPRSISASCTTSTITLWASGSGSDAYYHVVGW